MKIVRNPLEVRIQELETDKRILLKRIAALEKANFELRTKTTGTRTAPRRSQSIVSQSDADVPSYARATRSSITKLAQSSSTPSTSRPQSSVERDAEGKLVIPAAIEVAQFTKYTEASLARNQPGADLGWHGEVNPDGWVVESTPDCWATYQASISGSAADAATESRPEEPKIYCTEDHPCERCDFWRFHGGCAIIADMISKRLGDSSDTFQDTPAAQVMLRFKRQRYFLRKCHIICQEALWHALRNQFPHLVQRYYLEGPSVLLFGREDMKECFGSGYLPAIMLCGHSPKSFQDVLNLGIALRNAIAHQRPSESDHLDNMMRAAQVLAAQLIDEPRAKRVRALRDQMQLECRREYDAIVAYEPWMHLPGTPETGRVHPPAHHQLFFQRVLNPKWKSISTEEGRLQVYEASVVRAARAWADHFGTPGDDAPILAANMALAKTKYVNIREWNHGRGAPYTGTGNALKGRRRASFDSSISMTGGHREGKIGQEAGIRRKRRASM